MTYVKIAARYNDDVSVNIDAEEDDVNLLINASDTASTSVYLAKEGARTLRDELDKYIGDKPKPVTVGSINVHSNIDTAGLVKSYLDGLAKPVNESLRSILPGDLFVIAGRKSVVHSVGHDALTDTTTVKLYPIVPPKPPVPVVKVGDVINGDTLRAVQWKRGTVVRYDDMDGPLRWALLGDGRWANLDNGATRKFAAFGSRASYTVEYAPGK